MFSRNLVDGILTIINEKQKLLQSSEFFASENLMRMYKKFQFQ